MDVLSDVLRIIKMRGSLYFRTAFSAPWGVMVPAYRNVARFHLVSRGQCWIDVGNTGQSFLVSNGDLVVIPHGTPHSLSDASDTEKFELEQVLAETGFCGEGALVYGGQDDGSPTSLVCGHFEFDEDAKHPLLESLPPYIHVQGRDALKQVWLDDAMRFIDHEADSTKAGGDIIVNKLSEILFIQAIRAHVEAEGNNAKCLAGLLDPEIGRALRAVHRAPEVAWTVEGMAREAGLSRTRFAQRFVDLMALTPLQYVTTWRMQLARDLLAGNRNSVLDIATRVGYQSEAAFSRVFKRHFEVGPGAYRRQRSQRV